MQINWFTVIAQIVNFIILVWLLKRYLYKPILNAIDEREKKIVAQIADADAKKAEAIKEQGAFKQKNEKFEQEKKAMMDKAVAETNTQREKLLEAARNDANALRTTQEKAINYKKQELNDEIAQKTQTGVLAISRKVLADLASVGLEEQMAGIFIKKLSGLNEEGKKQFDNAFKSAQGAVIVKSAMAFTEKEKLDIKNAINEVIGAAPQCQFIVAPELISGIELTSNGYKLAWSVAAYLGSFEKSINGTAKAKQEAETN